MSSFKLFKNEWEALKSVFDPNQNKQCEYFGFISPKNRYVLAEKCIY